MERVGDVRMKGDHGNESAPLRPGEMIAGNSQITTSGGGLLILSRNGFQVTAGENTSFRLPTEESTSSLFLDRGWLRVRLAKPVDQEVRIKTAQFDINASRAKLTLRATPDGTNLSVDAGSAVLATTDHRHRATLVAGAAAKMGPTSGNELLIQPASGQGFTKISPPSATSQHPSSNLAILPASRTKKPYINRLEASNSDADESSLQMPMVSPSMPSKGVPRPSKERNVIPSSMPEVDDGSWTNTRPHHQQIDGLTFDPLELQFDRLTEGLVDGL
ncbi:MAG: FecR domain-containing protein [Geminicoccaceae bacterium]